MLMKMHFIVIQEQLNFIQRIYTIVILTNVMEKNNGSVPASKFISISHL